MATANEETLFELQYDSSATDRKALTKKIPLIVNFLEEKFGFDIEAETAKLEQRSKQYAEKKAQLQKRKTEELKKLETNAEKRSYELLFNRFKPVVNGEDVDWNFSFKTEEYETVTIKEAVQEKTNVFVSNLALTDTVQYLNDLEKAIDKTEFLIRRKDGTFYDFPRFTIKRVR